MQDIIIEKNEKKAKQRFIDLKLGREEIIKDGSKNRPNIEYHANNLAKNIHPKSIEVKVVKIEEKNNIKSFYLQNINGEKLPIYKPGSYITVSIKINNNIYKRAYTLSDIWKEKTYRITIKERGIVSKYFYNEIKEGDTFKITSPQALFTYNSIRDSKNIICICEEMGITSIYPIISELLEKKRIESIHLIYKSKYIKDIFWKEELEELAKKKKNFTLEFIITEEIQNEYKTKLNEEIIQNLNIDGKTFFISTKEETNKQLNQILKKLDIPNKYIRHEIYKSSPDFLLSIKHNLTIITNDKTITIPCLENETIVETLEKNNIPAPVSCTVGVCGYCRSKLISGEVKTENGGLRKKDIELKYIHPCVTYPLSDVTIELSK